MINRNVHSRSALDEIDSGQGFDPDLSTPPDALLPPDPYENSTAMLGEAPPGSQGEAGGAVLPSEGGPIAQSLAAMGMLIQGSQILSMHVPGFVPMEVTAWLQQAMQVLPSLLQQMQSGLAAAGPGAALGAGPLGALGPGPGMGGGMGMGASGAPPPRPSGPPQSQY